MRTHLNSVFLSLLVASLSLGQEKPVKAVFTDLAGNLRLLTGIEGAWEAPILLAERALSSGFNGHSLWFKTENELHIRSIDGSWTIAAAPDGQAAAYFSASGEPSLFYFSGPDRWASWNTTSHSLDLLDTPPVDAALPPETIGEDMIAIRRPDSILALSTTGAPAILIPLAELPSFQLFYRDGASEVAVGATFTMPPAAPGESSTARFRIRNPTNAPVLINRLSIDPGPFKTFDQFFPPRTMPPGGVLDFSVRFSPTEAGGYSRTLYVNDLKVILNANSSAVSVVELELPAGWQTLHAGDSVSLGSVERRTNLTRNLRITPASPVTLTGPGFSLLPGGTSTDFVVSFLSDIPGVFSATLSVEGRSFTLRVTVTDFPAPRPSILLQNDVVSAAQQGRLVVKLSEPTRTGLTGSLFLSFAPESGLPDDPAIVFLPQATRIVSLHFPEGATESEEVAFQSGTTAGTITLRAAIGNNMDERSFRILAEPVIVTATKAAVASANAEVVLTGYDTTRSTSKVAFTFYLRSGQPASPGKIEVDIAQQFANYYKSITGSSFSLRANFPVSGTHTEIDSVEVEIMNSVGTRQTGRLRFE